MDFPRRHHAVSLICFLSVLLLSAAPLTAQIERLYEDWRWVRFDVGSGLPSSRVLDVFETPTGRVWALTSAGLAWFDGYHWTPVECSWLRSLPAELPGIIVRNDYLVIAGMDSVLMINTGGCSIGTLPGVDTGSAELKRAVVDRIMVRRDSTIMIFHDGLLVPVPSPLDTMRDTGKRMKEGLWGFLYYDERPWLRVGNTLFRWTGKAWHTILRSPNRFLKVHLIATDHVGNGTGVFEAIPGQVNVYTWTAEGVAQRERQQEGDLVKSIAYTPSGEIVTIENTGAVRIKRKGKWSSLRHLPQFITNPLMMKFRPNGDLWVGTAEGLFLCRLSSSRWEYWQSPSSVRENIINEIMPAQDGSFWIGTRDGVCIRGRDGTERWVKDIGGTPLGRVTGIGQERNGNIWISSGASFTGAYRWDGRVWKHFGEAEGLTRERIHKIVPDRRGRLWLLGISGGLIQPNYKTEPGAFLLEGSHFTHWGAGEGLLDGRVYTVLEDRTGALWFGTYSGLSRLRNGVWKYWQQGSGLTLSRVFALAEDSSGGVWLAQNWQGVGYIDQHDSVHYLTTSDGVVDNQVWGLTVDPEGRVWITTMDGLGCYAHGEWLAFNTQTGLPNPQLWPVVFAQGKVYVGTQGSGVAILRYQPSDIPDPAISFDRPFESGGIVTIRWLANSYWGEPPSERILTRSRMDHGPWSAWSFDRRVQLSRVPAGDHVIEVQSKGPFGKVSSRLATLDFEVPYPVYLRLIFIGPITVLLLMLVGVTANHLRRKRRFEMALRDNEQRFRAQYRSNPIPAFTWQRRGDDFILTDSNEAGSAVLSKRFLATLGMSMSSIAQAIPAFVEMAHTCFREHASRRAEFTFPIPPEEGIIPIFDVAMAYVPPDMLLVHVRDITQEKLASHQIEESREHLRALAARLESVREEERKDLSREIHDELGQAMTGLKMDIAWIRRRLVEGRRDAVELVGERLTQMGNLLDETLRTVRRIAGKLRPVMLDDLGLAAAIEWQAKEFQQRTGIPTHVDMIYEDSVLGKEASTEVFRIFQEILTNIARHAGASNVDIRLEAENDTLLLRVSDDGSGIPLAAHRKPSGFGILGMEERARRAGGTIDIESAVGKGTIVRVSIPLKESI